MAQSYDESTKELNEEELKRELQELLDSQLEKSNEVCVEKEQQLTKEEPESEENVEQQQEEEPTKEFRMSEIQAFLNNQVRKQHQLHVQMVEEFEQQEEEEEDAENSREPQQHVILVTQNGDKIILIQNPNAENIDSSELESSAAAVAAAVGAGDKDRQLIPAIEYQPPIEIDEQEEYQIQMQHKFRQKMLMMQLEKLRGKKKAAEAHLPQTVVYENNEDSNPWKASDTSTDQMQEESDFNVRMVKKVHGSKKRLHSFDSDRVRVNAKWFHPLNFYLNKAYNYVKRRGNKIDQVCKYFPTSSHSFDSRCQDLKQDLLKLELNIERFQNILNKDLDSVENKMKNFIRDFHLDSILSEMETADEADTEELPVFRQTSTTEIHSLAGTSNMQLITPPTVTITPTTQDENSVDDDIFHKIKNCYDIEPVKEIRDIESPIEVLSEIESRTIPVSNSGIKPTVSVKPTKMSKAVGIIRPSTAPKFVKSSGRFKGKFYSTRSSGSSLNKVYRCKHPGCSMEFDNGAFLTAHIKEHIGRPKRSRPDSDYDEEVEDEEDYFDEAEEADEEGLSGEETGGGDVNGCEKNSFQYRIEGCTFDGPPEGKRPRRNTESKTSKQL